MTSHPLHACLIGVAFAVLSSSSLAADVPQSNGWPQWLQDAMAKESGKRRSVKIDVGNGYFNSRLKGKWVSKPQKIEGGWYMATNIGSDTSLECWIFSDLVDPATVASTISDASINNMVQQHGALQHRNIHHVDAGSYEGAPFLALEWMYSVGEAPDTLIGLTKVRTATINGTAFACAHNEVGYRDTFANAFQQFVASAKTAGENPNYYEEIVLQTIGNQRVGVAHMALALDDEGFTEITAVESMLIPVDNQTLHVSDTWRAGFSRPDGTLTNQNVAQSENGDLTMQLSLEPSASGDWQVSGTIQGKDFKQALDGGINPVSDLGQMLAVNAMMTRQQANPTTMDVWVPSADPGRFLAANVELDTHGEPGRGTVTIGPMSITAQFDSSGSMVTGSVHAGATAISLQRIWVRGELPHG